jgi:hypothetical protein
MKEMNGTEDETEVNALIYTEAVGTPFLIVGGESGKLAVIDIKRNNTCWVETDFIPSEIASLSLTKDK